MKIPHFLESEYHITLYLFIDCLLHLLKRKPHDGTVSFIHRCIPSTKRSAWVGLREIGVFIVQQIFIPSPAFRILLCHIDVYLDKPLVLTSWCMRNIFLPLDFGSDHETCFG